MSPEELQSQLSALLTTWESECVEFKDANDNFSTSDIGKYFSALANEANLRGLASAWLVFGVDNKTRAIIGTAYRPEHARLHSLKHQIAQGTDPATSFREIHELATPSGRVVLFEIPAAPRGLPIAWQTHFYARAGESLTGLSIAKQDEIRAQGLADDWSAIVVKEAAPADLDPAALAKAREVFLARYRARLPETTIRAWDDATFLEQAKLTVRGGITRACLLLLGRDTATALLNPYVAELSWKLEGPERGYEHFHPPFLLTTSLLFQRIRPLRLSFLPPGQLIPVEVSKYDQRIVLEALHNCIAHQDYTRCERVLVVERVGELEFQNAGDFFDGAPDDYVRGTRSPRRYRNRLLAEAMMRLGMIDTMGFGIREVMWKGQASRYLPLPDFDLTEPDHVKLRLQGRFLDENYSRTLLAHADLPWPDVLALDIIQKGGSPDDDSVKDLRHRGLIEGRKPKLHVAADIAAATDTEAEYIRHRAFDDRYFCDLILDYLKTFKEGQRADFERLLDGKLSDLLNARQKQIKIRNLLQRLRREGKIRPNGKTRSATWILA
ncbi:MAG: putative DNA binding domain-containing protein [Candidatus Didemnitutus sp.]|nr:putative DNA binding domain-containing protein [Candidatus Didemnitutus sp.]